MSDIEAIRCLADERGLEFVDLDGIGVDPAIGSLLTAEMARRHHVVPVKRKFGTPVIATAEPADLVVQDSLRAALGRDFITVVAAPEQIDSYLERLYGDGVPPRAPSDTAPPPATVPETGRRDQSFAVAPAPAVGPPDASAAEDPAAGAPPQNADALADLLALQTLGGPDDGSDSEDAHASFVPSNVLDIADLDDGTGFGLDDLAGVLDVEEHPEHHAAVPQPTGSVEEAAALVDEAVATFEELRQGVPIPAGPGDGVTAFPALAQALVDDGRVPLEVMADVVREHQETGQSVARILTARNLVTDADLMWGMATEMGLEFVDLDLVGIDISQAAAVPEATARHHNVMVIANRDGIPVVAASNPTDVFAMDDLRTIIGRRFIVVVATRSQISASIDRAFNAGGIAGDVAQEASLGIDGGRPESGPDDLQSATETAPIVRYVNLLILQALNERASDIHIEPTATDLRIRYRIDGVLHDVSTAPRKIAGAVTTRLKVMADMNIAERRVPQDGRISLNVGSKGIDLRLATLPTIHGEKVVMRVLDKSSVVLGFADLGFDDSLLGTYEHLYTRPYGTILVTGPSGSGKSTTLYTTLSALNSPEKNIITVEDPVELPLKGVNQIQVNVKAGLTFAAALRSILRADPDVVLIGEIRDRETAAIAVEAALTGHMVLATLHTNSAAATPMRLIEMGIEPYLVTSSLSGVLAQRLARRLCVHCKEPFEPTEADILAAGWSPEELESFGGIPKVYRSVGCTACAKTGYRGRLALAELLPMTEEVERMIIEGGSVDQIHRLAVQQGMSALRTSGLDKAVAGETTLEEVLRVVA